MSEIVQPSPAPVPAPVPVPAPRRRSKLTALAGFLIGFAAAIGLALLIGWWLFWRVGIRLDMTRPAVVQHVQQLQRLETVAYRMEKIVAGSQDNPYLPRLLAGDRILLIVYGEVTAGIDLAHLDAEAVQINGTTVDLAMPAPDIFSTRIDNQRTRVYSRETGLFTSPNPQLETEVRREAERQVRQAALDGGILAAASSSARTTLATFLKGLGFETVRFR